MLFRATVRRNAIPRYGGLQWRERLVWIRWSGASLPMRRSSWRIELRPPLPRHWRARLCGGFEGYRTMLGGIKDKVC